MMEDGLQMEESGNGERDELTQADLESEKNWQWTQ